MNAATVTDAVAQAVTQAPGAELDTATLLLSYLPASWEGKAMLVITTCAVLASVYVSLVQHIYHAELCPIAPDDISVYQKLLQIQPTVATYSAKIDNALTIVAYIRASYPDANVAEILEIIKDTILTQLDANGVSKSICGNLESNFAVFF